MERKKQERKTRIISVGPGDRGTHTHLSGLELILDAVLVALPLHLEGREDQAVTHEMRRVTHALAGLEAATREEKDE